MKKEDLELIKDCANYCLEKYHIDDKEFTNIEKFIEELVNNLPSLFDYDTVVVFDDGVHCIKERRK